MTEPDYETGEPRRWGLDDEALYAASFAERWALPLLIGVPLGIVLALVVIGVLALGWWR